MKHRKGSIRNQITNFVAIKESDINGEGNMDTSTNITSKASRFLRGVMFILLGGIAFGGLGYLPDAQAQDIQQLWQCQPGNLEALTTTQCATSGPDGWSSGNNSGPFVEGDTVPYKTVFINMTAEIEYRVSIEWDTTKSDKHALDYLNPSLSVALHFLSKKGLISSKIA